MGPFLSTSAPADSPGGRRTSEMYRIRATKSTDEGYDPVGGLGVSSARRTALLAIEEVFGGGAQPREGETAWTVEAPPVGKPAELAPPASKARIKRSQRRGMHRLRRRGPSARRRLWVVGLTLAVALLVGTLIGSGQFSAESRFNAERLAAQQDSAELYDVPEVHKHPGATPAAARSGSMREFLGMASAF